MPIPVYSNTEKKAIKTAYLSIVGNSAIALIKGLTGFFGNSFALIADAIESTSDIFSSILVLFGIKYSSRPADANHPYGHGKVEPLITFLVIGFLISSAILIGIQCVKNIQTPHELPKGYTLIILGIIIISKEIFFRVVNKKSIETKSTSLKADAWHHRSDAITSFAVFIGISIALFFGKGYESADDWAALAACCIILYNSYLLFRPAIGEIMDEDIHQDLILRIRNISSTVEGVQGTEKCYARKSGMKYHVDLHICVLHILTVREGHNIAHLLKKELMKKLPEIANILIHVEPVEK